MGKSFYEANLNHSYCNSYNDKNSETKNCI